MATVDEILDVATKLPADQRYTLAHRILLSTEPDDSEELAAEWDSEIRARIARFDCGQSQAIPVDEVFAEVDARLNALR